MKRFLVIVLGLTLFCTTLMAGHRTGNGGVGVLINGKTYLLDMQEVKLVNKESMPEYKSMLMLLKKIIRFNSAFAKPLVDLTKRNAFYLFFTDFSLMRTHDANSPVRFKGTQIAVQRDRFVVVNREKWEALSFLERRATLTHEMLVMLYPNVDRFKVRILNYMLNSNNLKSRKDLDDFLRAAGKPFSKFAGWSQACIRLKEFIRYYEFDYIQEYKRRLNARVYGKGEKTTEQLKQETAQDIRNKANQEWLRECNKIRPDMIKTMIGNFTAQALAEML